MSIVLEEKHISANEFRVNEGIRVAEVRLIGPDGSNVGVVPIKEALKIAREAELDLVEVSPGANPPVCRVMDFGKFIYEKAKKEREARKSQTKIEVKVAGRGNVPANATAAFFNVTVVNPSAAGFITLYPCGTRPTTSNVNHTAGVVRANNAMTQLSANGTVCIYSKAAADVVLDVTGWVG